MANLENIGHRSITDMDPDEALEELRQIRLRRNQPAKRKSVSTRKKIAQSKAADVKKISSGQAAALLKILQDS
jgi:hypothetical protein